jgi:hypothetical protein
MAAGPDDEQKPTHDGLSRELTLARAERDHAPAREAAFGALLTYDGERLTMVAYRNAVDSLVEHWRQPQPVDPGRRTDRALREGPTIRIEDLAHSDGYRNRSPVASVELGGIRTLLQMPLVGERGAIGTARLPRRRRAAPVERAR